jgi:hypothetical protein
MGSELHVGWLLYVVGNAKFIHTSVASAIVNRTTRRTLDTTE